MTAPVRGDTSTLTVPVGGMTCRACERKVGKALSALPGVSTVDVSVTRGRATLVGDRLPGRAAVEAAIRRAGYSPQAPAWLSREPSAWATVAVAVATVAVLGFLVVRLDLGSLVGVDGRSGLAVALLVGLAAGVSTCMALVGGLVVALTAAYGARHPERVASWPGRVWPQVSFNAGRILGFAAGGAALGAVGSAFQLPTTVMAAAVLVAAVVMTILGIRLTGLSPRIAAWSPTLPGRWGERLSGSGAGGYSDLRAALAGTATFLLPCGFTQAMQIYAVSTGSPLEAAAIMVAFAIGTTPGLLGLGVAAGAASSWGGARALRVVGVVVLAFALLNATGSLSSLGVGLPWRSAASASTTLSANVTVAGGVQTVTMTQTGQGYRPADTTVYAGLPIRWVVDSTAPLSCAAFLRVPSLGVRADLKAGANTVDLPALDAGRTSFTCVMGMYNGSLTAIPPPDAAPS